MSESNAADVIEVPRALLNQLVDRLDDLEAELSEYRAANERDKATIRQDVCEVTEKAGDGDSDDTAAQSDESVPSDDSITPMERITPVR